VRLLEEHEISSLANRESSFAVSAYFSLRRAETAGLTTYM